MYVKLDVALIVALLEHAVVEDVCDLGDLPWRVHYRHLLHYPDRSLLLLLCLLLLLGLWYLWLLAVDDFPRDCIQAADGA